MAFQDLRVHSDSLRDAGTRMDDVAAELDSLRLLIENNAYLPPLTFGSVGEPARFNYESSRSDELANLVTGTTTAHTLAENFRRSRTQYLTAEDAGVRAVLHDIGWLPGSGGAFNRKAAAEPAPSVSAKGSPADFVAVPATAAVIGAGAMKIGQLGTATAANLKACTGVSALTIGAATVWATVVWAYDYAVNSAVQTWDEVARRARALFGSDVTGVGKVLQSSWHGTAATSADGRMMEFVVAGMALADRAEARVAALRALIDELTWIHRIAFVVSTLMLVATVGTILTVGIAVAAAYAEWFLWIVVCIEGLMVSWGLIAMWDQSQNGFALSGADSGSAAQAVATLSPPYPTKMQTLPPPFSF